MNGSPLGPGMSLKGLAVPLVLEPFSPAEDWGWGVELVNLRKGLLRRRATSPTPRLKTYMILIICQTPRGRTNERKNVYWLMEKSGASAILRGVGSNLTDGLTQDEVRAQGLSKPEPEEGLEWWVLEWNS